MQFSNHRKPPVFTHSKAENPTAYAGSPIGASKSRGDSSVHNIKSYSNIEPLKSVRTHQLLKLQHDHSGVTGMSSCCRKTFCDGHLSVTGSKGEAKVKNLFLCKNHLCPICSIKRANDENEKTQIVLEKLNSCYFGTFTIKTKNDWKEHKDELLSIWNAYSTRIKTFFDRKFGKKPAIIRGLDFTLHPYEQNEGLHFHIHCLIGFESVVPMNDEEVRDYLEESWIQTALKRGNDCSRRGQKVIPVKTTGDKRKTGAYVTKSVLSDFGSELVAITKNGSGLFEGRMGFGRFITEILVCREEDKERLTRLYTAICKFLRGTKWTSKNALWRDLEKVEDLELEDEETDDTEDNKRVIEFDKEAGRLLLHRHSRNLIAYCKRLVIWGDSKEFSEFRDLVSFDYFSVLHDAYEDDLERREVFFGLVEEHFHKFRVEIDDEDKGKVHFVR